MTESNFTDKRYCSSCGAPLQTGAAFCPSCGTNASSVSKVNTPASSRNSNVQELDWREQRRQMREQRRAERRSGPTRGVGGLIVAMILIVAGLGIFFPSLPWQVFWGSILIVIGLLIVYAWVRRRDEYGSKSQPQQQS